MRKLKSILSPKRICLILTICIFVLSISFINKPAQSQTQGIVTSVAIDRDEGQINLACAVITPVSGHGRQTNTYTAKGETLSLAVDKISIQLGKQLGFSQCDIIAVGNQIVEENLSDVLDFFVRTKKIGENVFLVNYEGDTKEFIEAIAYLQDKLSLTLSQILKYNEENILSVSANLESFFLGLYSDSRVSILPKFLITEEKLHNGIEVEINNFTTTTSSGQSSGGDGASGDQNKRYLLNDGTTCVLKNGKKKLLFTPEDVRKINLLAHDSKVGTFIVNDITDEFYDDATVVLKLEDKSMSFKYKIENNIPIMSVSANFYLKVDEIIENSRNPDIMRRDDELLTNTVVDKVKSQIKNDMEIIFNKLKNNNIDYIQLYSDFNKYNPKKWKKYLNSLEDKDNYLENVELDIKIKVAQYL